MIEWFKKLNNTNRIAVAAIAIPIIFAAIGGIIKIFGIKNAPSAPKTKINQFGSGHTAINIDGGKLSMAQSLAAPNELAS